MDPLTSATTKTFPLYSVAIGSWKTAVSWFYTLVTISTRKTPKPTRLPNMETERGCFESGNLEFLLGHARGGFRNLYRPNLNTAKRHADTLCKANHRRSSFGCYPELGESFIDIAGAHDGLSRCINFHQFLCFVYLLSRLVISTFILAGIVPVVQRNGDALS